MKEHQGSKGHDPERLFRELKDRPTPELDSNRLWMRVASGLTPRQARWWRMAMVSGKGRPVVLRLGYVATGITVLALAAWAGISLLNGGQQDAPGAAGQLADSPELEAATAPILGPRVVRLVPELPDSPAAVVDEGAGIETVNLQVRLVRGFSGPVPADVEAAAALGAGGADVLADVRPEVTSLPFEEYGLLGRWDGELSAVQSVQAELSGSYTLSFATAERVLAGNYVELSDVRLVGAIDVRVASSLRLEPGRLHLLGVVGPGDEVPSIILAIKVDAASDAPNTKSSIH